MSISVVRREIREVEERVSLGGGAYARSRRTVELGREILNLSAQLLQLDLASVDILVLSRQKRAGASIRLDLAAKLLATTTKVLAELNLEEVLLGLEL